jgi:hypothetical protein
MTGKEENLSDIKNKALLRSEFVIKYPGYISQLEAVVKPGHLPAIEKLRALDPHDTVRPEHYFNSEAEAVGVVFRMFLRQISK